MTGYGSVSYSSHLSTIPLLTPVNLLICFTERPSFRSFNAAVPQFDFHVLRIR
jgi:hypothetical protein